MIELSISGQIIRENLVGLQAQYPNWPDLLEGCGVRYEELEQQGRRFPIDMAVKLHRQTLNVLDDESLGLLDRRTPRGMLRQLALSTVHTRTLDKALVRFAEMATLFENTFRYTVEHAGRDTLLQIVHIGDPGRDRRFILSWLMTIIHRLIGWMANERLVPRVVNFDFAAPEYHSEYYYAFYGAPVRYNADTPSIVFKTSDLELPIVQNEASVERYIQRYPVDLLIPVEMGGDLSREVRRRVMESLELYEEVPGIEDIAAALSLHPRALRRKLKSERSSYKNITMQVRRDVAMYHLGHNDISIEKIAERAGYADTSSFIRVFKSWTGFTPLTFRKGL